MLYLLLLAAATPSPVCAKLHEDFDNNEKSWSSAAYADKVYLDSTRRLASAAYRTAADASRYERALAMSENTAQRHAERADRIVVLISGHGCHLPDHVASADRYWDLAVGEQVEVRSDQHK